MRRTYPFNLAIVLLSGPAVMIGCGSDDNPGETPSLHSGLTPEKTLDQLSTAEAEQLCSSMMDFVERTAFASKDDFRRTSCVLLAAFVSTTVEECNQTVDQCLAEGEGDVPVDAGGRDCEPSSAPLTECTATVSEFESCVQASVELGIAAVNSLSCETLFSDSTSGAPPLAAADPAACEPLGQKCPELLAQVSESESLEAF